jgi:hypothetical protein
MADKKFSMIASSQVKPDALANFLAAQLEEDLETVPGIGELRCVGRRATLTRGPRPGRRVTARAHAAPPGFVDYRPTCGQGCAVAVLAHRRRPCGRLRLMAPFGARSNDARLAAAPRAIRRPRQQEALGGGGCPHDARAHRRLPDDARQGHDRGGACCAAVCRSERQPSTMNRCHNTRRAPRLTRIPSELQEHVQAFYIFLHDKGIKHYRAGKSHQAAWGRPAVWHAIASGWRLPPASALSLHTCCCRHLPCHRREGERNRPPTRNRRGPHTDRRLLQASPSRCAPQLARLPPARSQTNSFIPGCFDEMAFSE